MAAIDFKIFDLLISLILIYLTMSILVSLINEIIVTNFSLRGIFLKKAISNMLDDDEIHLSEKFYSHPLIKKIKPQSTFNKYLKWLTKGHLPSYLSKDIFAKVVVDLLASDGKGEGRNINDIKNTLLSYPEECETRIALLTLLNASENNVDKFKDELSNWFEDVMERLSGIFKRFSQISVFIIALILSVLFNVDTIKVVHHLSNDKVSRTAMAKIAVDFLESEKERLSEYNVIYADSLKSKTNKNENQIEDIITKSDSLSNVLHNLFNQELSDYFTMAGIGWGNYNSEEDQNIKSDEMTVFKIMGWLITALAVSLGAPFWFDILNKVIYFRGSKKTK